MPANTDELRDHGVSFPLFPPRQTTDRPLRYRQFLQLPLVAGRIIFYPLNGESENKKLESNTIELQSRWNDEERVHGHQLAVQMTDWMAL